MYSEYITATVLLLAPSHSNIIWVVVWFFEGEEFLQFSRHIGKHEFTVSRN